MVGSNQTAIRRMKMTKNMRNRAQTESIHFDSPMWIIFIHFNLRFIFILLILIQFDFLWIMIHSLMKVRRIMIYFFLMIRFRIKSESSFLEPWWGMVQRNQGSGDFESAGAYRAKWEWRKGFGKILRRRFRRLESCSCSTDATLRWGKSQIIKKTSDILIQQLLNKLRKFYKIFWMIFVLSQSKIRRQDSEIEELENKIAEMQVRISVRLLKILICVDHNFETDIWFNYKSFDHFTRQREN